MEKKKAVQKKIEAAVDRGCGTMSWFKQIDKNQQHTVLPEHVELGLTSYEQAQDYAHYISMISSEYVPISVEGLPDRVQHALNKAIC